MNVKNEGVDRRKRRGVTKEWRARKKRGLGKQERNGERGEKEERDKERGYRWASRDRQELWNYRSMIYFRLK